MVLKKGSSAFWEPDSVIPASLCLNEALRKGPGGSHQLPGITSLPLPLPGQREDSKSPPDPPPPHMFWDLLEEPRLRLKEARNFK